VDRDAPKNPRTRLFIAKHARLGCLVLRRGRSRELRTGPQSMRSQGCRAEGGNGGNRSRVEERKETNQKRREDIGTDCMPTKLRQSGVAMREWRQSTSRARICRAAI
jgi:hypothetical protein